MSDYLSEKYTKLPKNIGDAGDAENLSEGDSVVS